MEAGLLRLRVFAAGLGQRRFCGDGLDRPIDAVISRNAVEVPLNHLRDRVAMLTVERMQTINGDIHQVAVHHGARGLFRQMQRGLGQQCRRPE